MKKYFILIFCLIAAINSYSQTIIENEDGSISIKGDSIAFFDTNNNLISSQAHDDSLKTHKYIVQIKGNEQVTEVHLVNKYPNPETLIGKQLPKIKFYDLNDKEVKTTDSNIILLSFWNIHCKPCIEELIVLNIIAEEYPNTKFLALTADKKEDVLKFMNRLNIKWENISIITDYQDDYYDILKIRAYPSSVAVNNDFDILDVFISGYIRRMLRSLDNLDKDDN